MFRSLSSSTIQNEDSLLTLETKSRISAFSSDTICFTFPRYTKIENPRQHLTTQPFGNIQHRFLSRHFAPTRHIVPFAVLGWDILILLKKIACHRETNPPLSPPFWRYAYACAMVFMTRILSFETDYPRVSRNPTRWSRGTKTLGTRLGKSLACALACFYRTN